MDGNKKAKIFEQEGIEIMEKKVNFEENIKQLEEIAKQLEKGDLNLDESVLKFEEGMKLSKACSEILENAEKIISILIKEEEGVSEEEFNVE